MKKLFYKMFYLEVIPAETRYEYNHPWMNVATKNADIFMTFKKTGIGYSMKLLHYVLL